MALDFTNAFADDNKTFEGDINNSRTEVFWMEVMFLTHRFGQIDSANAVDCDRKTARTNMESELLAAKDRIAPLIQDADDLTSDYRRVQKVLNQRIDELQPCI